MRSPTRSPKIATILALLACPLACGGASAGGQNEGGKAGMTAAAGSPGTAGTGTGGAGSSSGGEAGGMTACVPGATCATENAQCSVGGCCACTYSCKNGQWGDALCPPCLVRLCPDVVPQNGDACPPCQLPSGGCRWDRRPVDGPLYVGQCVAERWQISITPPTPPACCTSDSQCAPGICVNTICEQPSPDFCWRDDACATNEICSGAFVCGCAADCSGRDAPGRCVPAGQGCCKTDGDCKGAGMCVSGVCKQGSASACWSDRDCAIGDNCYRPQLCPCGTSCFAADAPGICVTPL